jgi:hypothetical protein
MGCVTFSVSTMFFMVRFLDDLVDGVSVVNFLDVKWDMDHQFLSAKKLNFVSSHTLLT